MKGARFLRVTRRILQGLRNDRRTLALMFLAPLVAMFLFGIAFSGDVKDVPVIVVNDDEGAGTGAPSPSLSEAVISNLDTGALKIEYGEDVDGAVSRVEDGGAYGVIHFPAGFTASALAAVQGRASAGGAAVELLLDKSSASITNAVVKGVNDALLATLDELGRELPVSVDASQAVYGQGARFIDFFVPGVMAFVVFVITTLLTLISFVGEKTTGTLDRLLATPLSEGGVVMGYATAFGVVGIVQSALLLTVAILVFKVMVEGNVALSFAVIALLAVVSQALGILLSSLARREAQAVQFFPFIILPAFLLAGVFWPLEAIPAWLRPLSYLIPPTYAVDACRSVMLRGWGIAKIWLDIAALLAFAAAFLLLSTWTLRRRKA